MLSSLSDGEFYLREFDRLARELEGLVERCYFSFVMPYRKVDRNFRAWSRPRASASSKPRRTSRSSWPTGSPRLPNRTASGCTPAAANRSSAERSDKAHCIDGALIEQLFYPQGLAWNEKPTRPGCGCTESLDLGTYDTCPHGCIYCYANANKAVARGAFDRHDPTAAFLGFAKSQSDAWLAELRAGSLLP